VLHGKALPFRSEPASDVGMLLASEIACSKCKSCAAPFPAAATAAAAFELLELTICEISMMPKDGIDRLGRNEVRCEEI